MEIACVPQDGLAEPVVALPRLIVAWLQMARSAMIRVSANAEHVGMQFEIRL